MSEDETEMRDVPEHEVQRGGGFGRMLGTILVTGVILVLGLTVLYLLSERNARRYFLEVDEGQVLVKRGAFWPGATRPFLPDDPELAAAYEPVPIPTGVDVEPRRTFNERADLDRALVDQLLTWSRERLDLEQPERLEQGIYYLRRAERLPTTTAAQRADMDTLRGEVAYHEGRRFIDSALRNLDIARERLTQARDSPAGWGRESRELLRAIREPERALRQALRGVGPDPAIDAPTPSPEVEPEPEVDTEVEVEAEPGVAEDPVDEAPAPETGTRPRRPPDGEAARRAEPADTPALVPLHERAPRRGLRRREAADAESGTGDEATAPAAAEDDGG